MNIHIGDIITDVYCNQTDCIYYNTIGICQKDTIVLDDLIYQGIPRINEFKCRFYSTNKGDEIE